MEQFRRFGQNRGQFLLNCSPVSPCLCKNKWIFWTCLARNVTLCRLIILQFWYQLNCELMQVVWYFVYFDLTNERVVGFRQIENDGQKQKLLAEYRAFRFFPKTTSNLKIKKNWSLAYISLCDSHKVSPEVVIQKILE